VHRLRGPGEVSKPANEDKGPQLAERDIHEASQSVDWKNSIESYRRSAFNLATRNVQGTCPGTRRKGQET
jgi:hypothetical protein